MTLGNFCTVLTGFSHFRFHLWMKYMSVILNGQSHPPKEEAYVVNKNSPTSEGLPEDRLGEMRHKVRPHSLLGNIHRSRSSWEYVTYHLPNVHNIVVRLLYSKKLLHRIELWYLVLNVSIMFGNFASEAREGRWNLWAIYQMRILPRNTNSTLEILFTDRKDI